MNYIHFPPSIILLLFYLNHNVRYSKRLSHRFSSYSLSSLCDLLVRRFFAEIPAVNIVEEGASAAAPAAEKAVVSTAKAADSSMKMVVEQPKMQSMAPKVAKEQPKKKRSTVRPFLYGCAFAMVAGYFFVYQQIWNSAHQMEQALADIRVDTYERLDRMSERVSELESKI